MNEDRGNPPASIPLTASITSTASTAKAGPTPPSDTAASNGHPTGTNNDQVVAGGASSRPPRPAERPRLASNGKPQGSAVPGAGQQQPDQSAFASASASASASDDEQRKQHERKNLAENEKTIRTGSFRRPNPVHNRGVSWDDKNLMELFSKPAASDSKIPTRARGTSSDANSDPSTSPRSSNPASPSVASVPMIPPSDMAFSLSSSSSAVLSPRTKMAKANSRRSHRRLDMMDVVGPNELEAETFILQTLEERDPIGSRSRTGTMDYSVLSNVPNEIGHDFELLIPPTTPKRVGTVVANSLDPVLQAASKLTPSAKEKNRHKRTLTVEETIFGLSSALSAIHGTHADDPGVQNEVNIDSPNEDPAGASASTDRLARTVNILFNRTRANTSGGHSAHGKTSEKHQQAQSRPSLVGENVGDNGPKRSPASNWRVLQGNLGNYKKDEDSFQKMTDDVEQGNVLSGRSSFGVEEGEGEEEEGNDGNNLSTDDETDDPNISVSERRRRSRRSRRNPFRHLPYGDMIREEWDTVNSFLKPRRNSIFLYMKVVFVYLMIPLIGIAAILFYFVDNPPTGQGRVYENNTTASASWWLLFAARNLVTFTLAKISELIVIDFFSLQTTFTLRICGPVITLLIVQSKGWPFLLSAWSIFDFALLVGSHPFTNHWLYWQGFISLFNRDNPGGDVTESEWLYRLLVVSLVVGIAVSIKRLVVGLYLGRKTFSNYSKQLAKVMNRMLLISEVSAEAKEIEKKSWMMERMRRSDPSAARSLPKPSMAHISSSNLNGLVETADDEDDGDTVTNEYHTVKSQASSLGALERIIDTSTGQLSQSQRSRISQLLGQWEEPARGTHQKSDVAISAVLQFRRALVHMDTNFPFSPAFGVADTRESCVASAQEVFLRLLLKTPESEGTIPFETIATVALQRNGELDTEKVKDLIRVFRPDRDGSLTLIDFVRSVDSVYKELRLLRATVVSSSKIDEALENIMNILFYGVMVTVILSQLGFDPLALFLSLSSVIVAFAFMISSASAKYFEGLLFILVQRPYGIGDRIGISNPESESSNSGAQGWIVEDVTLFTTSIVLAATNERATISNGSLAKSRIINGARSPKAVLFFTLKFGLDVPYEKIDIFKSAVEKFVKARPREWLSLLGLRATRVEADLGFIEYIVVLQHRERWQNIVPLLQSKAILQSFCLELQKKMDMRYYSPSLPVDLKVVGNPGLPAQILGDAASRSMAEGQQQQQQQNQENADPVSAAYAGMMDQDLDAVAAMFDGQ